MFINFLNVMNGHEMLVNLETVDKLEVRPIDEDPASVNWEVCVFYRNERRYDPNAAGDPQWVGTYDVVVRATEKQCRQVLKQIREHILDQTPVCVISHGSLE